MSNHQTALVLGGGGHFGIAFETGYLRGLDDQQLNLRGAASIMGSSAGSQVGAVMASAKSWTQIWHDQIEQDVAETTPISDDAMGQLFQQYNRLPEISTDAKDWITHLGEISVKTPEIIPAADRLAMIANRIGDGVDWSDSLRIVATRISDAKRVVFDAHSNVPLLQALAASSALPGVWPSIKINGEAYYDGGSYSMDNPDLITDADNVVVISNNLPVLAPYKTSELVAKMTARGTRTCLITPGAKVVAILAKYANNTMEAALRSEVANAAREQGRAEAEALKAQLGRA